MWKQIHNVVVGSVINVYDTDRKVVQVKSDDLMLEGKHFPISLQSLVIAKDGRDSWDGHEHSVYVVSEPKVDSSTLSNSSFIHGAITQRFAGNSVAPSFRDQLEARFGRKTSPTPNIYTGVAQGYVTGKPDPSADLHVRLAMAKAKAPAVSQFDPSSLEDEIESVRDHVNDEIEEVYDRFDGVDNEVSDLQERLAKLEHEALALKINKDLENKKDTVLGGNKMSIKTLLSSLTAQFGKVEGQFALSPAGMAMKADPKNPFSGWIVYDKATGQLTDVGNLKYDINLPAFKFPVEAAAVNVGDIVLNDNKFQYVIEVNDDYLSTISPANKARSSVYPVKNLLLGKLFYTVVKTLDLAGQAGFNPMLLMALGKGESTDSLLPLLLMGGLGGAAGTTPAAGGIDPMTLMALAGNGDISDMLPLLLMGQGGLGGATAGGINPLMLMALSDKGGKGSLSDILPLLLMQGGAGGLGNLFGGTPATAPVAPKATTAPEAE